MKFKFYISLIYNSNWKKSTLLQPHKPLRLCLYISCVFTQAPVALVQHFTCMHAQVDPWCNRCLPHPPQSSTLPATDWLSPQGRLRSVTRHQDHSPEDKRVQMHYNKLKLNVNSMWEKPRMNEQTDNYSLHTNWTATLTHKAWHVHILPWYCYYFSHQ